MSRALGDHTPKIDVIAPKGCIVCGKAHPGGDNLPGWSYLAGSTPMGAITCSTPCLNRAIERHHESGRVDVPSKRER